ncbi:MAG: hypothetical protein JWR23_308 [Mucilaginibacter sp.]|nr:hypothetical protein [Mucilaginibacter sp.]
MIVPKRNLLPFDLHVQRLLRSSFRFVTTNKQAVIDKTLAKQTLKLCKATTDALTDDLKKVEAGH